jgi:hypothetical protein
MMWRFCSFLSAVLLFGSMMALAQTPETAKAGPPITRVPVVRAPTTGKPVITSLPQEDRVGSQADLFFMPEPDLLPLNPQSGSTKKPSRACISTMDIRSADVLDDSTIRLTLRKRKQVDMKLRGTCFGLAFDESFYYQPGPGAQLCERMDTIVARSGSRCLIDSFVAVAPAAKK